MNRPVHTARQIVAAAAQQSPSIDATAEPLALTCLEILDAEPGLTPPELARRCMARHPEADVSWITQIARIATRID